MATVRTSAPVARSNSRTVWAPRLATQIVSLTDRAPVSVRANAAARPAAMERLCSHILDEGRLDMIPPASARKRAAIWETRNRAELRLIAVWLEYKEPFPEGSGE